LAVGKGYRLAMVWEERVATQLLEVPLNPLFRPFDIFIARIGYVNRLYPITALVYTQQITQIPPPPLFSSIRANRTSICR